MIDQNPRIKALAALRKAYETHGEGSEQHMRALRRYERIAQVWRDETPMEPRQ